MGRNTPDSKVTDQTQSDNRLDTVKPKSIIQSSPTQLQVNDQAHSTDGRETLKPKGAIRSGLTQPQMMEHARNQATFDSSKLTELILGR